MESEQSFECGACQRFFNSEHALQQHIRDSAAHQTTFDCDLCDRSFNTREALEQHVRDSVAHPTYDCGLCDRYFITREALDQHIRDSPVHQPTFDCGLCDRTFNSQDALDQHVRDSPAHQSTLPDDDLEHFHIRSSSTAKKKRREKKRIEIPAKQLEAFFGQYPDFDYDPNQPSSSEFYRMVDQFGWEKDDDDRIEAREEFKDALVKQFNDLFGTDVDDLKSWQGLCVALDIVPFPDTIEDTKLVLENKFVNLVDLVDGQRLGEPVTTFKSLEELRSYTQSTGKYFPKESAYAGGFLRFLLREILHKYEGTKSRRRFRKSQK